MNRTHVSWAGTIRDANDRSCFFLQTILSIKNAYYKDKIRTLKPKHFLNANLNHEKMEAIQENIYYITW